MEVTPHCPKCRRACCQCDLCAKVKGHTGLCSACFKIERSHVEPSAATKTGKAGEANGK